MSTESSGAKTHDSPEDVGSSGNDIFTDHSLSFSELCDKLSGLIHGCLLAETYARTKTNMTNQKLNYWGFTTDQLLLMMKNITNSGQFDPKHYMRLLQDYSSMQGISDMLKVKSELDDQSELKERCELLDSLSDMDFYTKEVVFHTKALIKPINAAMLVEKSKYKKGHQTDHNTPLIRCVLAGLFDNWDKLSNQVCMVTHTDHRCISAGIIYSVIVYSMLSGLQTKVVSTVQETAGLISKMNKIKEAKFVDEFMRYTSEGYMNNLDLVSLDETTTAYKTMTCSMYALKSFVKCPTSESFYRILDTLIDKGGDIETNCALAGALMGCELGYNGLHIDKSHTLDEIRKPYFDAFKKIEAEFFKRVGFARVDGDMPVECHRENGWYLVIDYEKKRRMEETASQMLSPKEKEPSSPKEKEPSSPKEKEPSSPKEKESSSPKEKESSSPKETEPSSPKEKEPSSPKEKEPSSPKEKV